MGYRSQKGGASSREEDDKGSCEPSNEGPLFAGKGSQEPKKQNKKARKIIIRLIIFLALLGVIFGHRIQEGFTSVEKLTRKYYEDSVFEVCIGAICRDGWISSATGRGAYSHHGGVKKWIYKKIYRKTYAQCEVEARKKS